MRWIAGAGFFLFAVYVCFICFGPNFHAVIPGRVFRSAQLDKAELEQAVSRCRLKTIINLRGECPEQPWKQDEQAVAKAHGAKVIDINLSTYMPPHRDEFRKLAQALETAEEPFLIHCRQGADRTSLASAIGLLLKTDATLAEAREQLSIRYGHAPFGKVTVMDRALDDYEAWLAEQRTTHSKERLRHWIADVYLPGPFWATIEPIDVPDTLVAGQWTTARVKVTNRSRQPWQFRQDGHVGFHVSFHVTPKAGGRKWAHNRAGLFDKELKPGESLVFDLAIPPIHAVGAGVLKVDLEDEEWCLFDMVGSPPLVKEITVLPWPTKPPLR